MFDLVTQDTFTEFVKSNENVIAYFWTQWCGACKMQDPILEQILKISQNSLKVARVDIQQNPALAQAYQVLGTPTLMFFKKGNKVRFKAKSGVRIDRLVGAQDFQRLQEISRYVINMTIIKMDSEND
ncbi:MAG: thioredoxin [Promethearchaeota archaeon]|nr:MAG: thioredoxin [Candidatus Lokiarchaeota archaeon]